MDQDLYLLLPYIRALLDSGVLPRLLGVFGRASAGKSAPASGIPPTPPTRPVPTRPVPLTIVVNNTGSGSVEVQVVYRCDDSDEYDCLKQSA